MMFSIIIPVYNVEKTITECVNSVLSQSYRDFEIILVDDGSTDNSPRICDELAKSNNRIVVIHKNNGGLSSARNVGMKEVKGDYFLFLDSDDYWTYNDFLKNLFEIINEYNSEVIVFKLTPDKKLISDRDRNIELEKVISNNNKAGSFKYLILNDRLLSSACDKVYKSTLYNNEKYRFTEGVFSEDIDWTARIVLSSERIAYLDRYAYYYRPNESSITHNIKAKNVLDLCNSIKKIVKFSEQIINEDYYEWYMSYCAYQYITFLNVAAQYSNKKEIESEIKDMKGYSYLLDYHYNHKVKLCYVFNKVFGYKNTITILKMFLKFRG